MNIAAIDRFIHSRNHDCRVTCILPRCIDRMVKPWSIRQSFRNQKSTLGLAKRCIQALGRGRKFPLLLQNFCAGLFQMMSAVNRRGKVGSFIAELLPRALFLAASR